MDAASAERESGETDTESDIAAESDAQASPLPPFISKLSELVNDPSTQSLVRWSEEHHGNAFVVWDPVEFSATVLPKHFKHSNFCSFVRQLNIYGFHKIESDKGGFAFRHEFFRKDAPQLLKKIVRRRAPQPGRNGSCAAGAPTRRETALLAAAALSEHAATHPVQMMPPPPPPPPAQPAAPAALLAPHAHAELQGTKREQHLARVAAPVQAASPRQAHSPVQFPVSPSVSAPSAAALSSPRHSPPQPQPHVQPRSPQQHQQQQQHHSPQQQQQFTESMDAARMCKLVLAELTRLREMNAQTNATVAQLRDSLAQASAKEEELERRVSRMAEAMQAARGVGSGVGGVVLVPQSPEASQGYAQPAPVHVQPDVFFQPHAYGAFTQTQMMPPLARLYPLIGEQQASAASATAATVLQRQVPPISSMGFPNPARLF
eukprot:m51a1_g6352 putative heat shock transcription (433) ;mRNA; f:83521-85379